MLPRNVIKTFPMLFKTSGTGKIQQWEIRVVRLTEGINDLIIIETEYGQVGGKLQIAQVEVEKGKNAGRANETDRLAQALNEARSKHAKQIDKGYSTSPSTSRVLRPMLAHRYDEYPHKMTFPCYWQPKLDGLRCLAYRQGSDIVLESRRGKRFKVLRHIEEALGRVLRTNEVLDGELYCHHTDFQKIISAVKRDEPSEHSKLIEYHLYDIVRDDLEFSERWKRLADFSFICQNHADNFENCSIVLVKTELCKSAEDVFGFHKQAKANGYEGIMLRSFTGKYLIDKRSYDLLKVKEFHDAEFEIVDVEEGVGRMKGQAIFVCKTESGTLFKSTPEGTDEMRAAYWDNRKHLIGRKLTVRYFEMTTSDNPVPRFPIGISVREVWD